MKAIQLELPLFLPILKKRKNKKAASQTTGNILGDGLGWREEATQRDKAICILAQVKHTEQEWRELVRQGKAKVTTERINFKTIKQHYEIII